MINSFPLAKTQIPLFDLISKKTPVYGAYWLRDYFKNKPNIIACYFSEKTSNGYLIKNLVYYDTNTKLYEFDGNSYNEEQFKKVLDMFVFG